MCSSADNIHDTNALIFIFVLVHLPSYTVVSIHVQMNYQTNMNFYLFIYLLHFYNTITLKGTYLDIV